MYTSLVKTVPTQFSRNSSLKRTVSRAYEVFLVCQKPTKLLRELIFNENILRKLS